MVGLRYGLRKIPSQQQQQQQHQWWGHYVEHQLHGIRVCKCAASTSSQAPGLTSLVCMQVLSGNTCNGWSYPTDVI
jgi:hypothetical protein